MMKYFRISTVNYFSLSLLHDLYLSRSINIFLPGRAESALNLKISQFDEDMSSRQATLDELKKSYAQESAEFALLKGTYVSL